PVRANAPLKIMTAAVNGLVWEIWRRNRHLVWIVMGILFCACAFNQLLPESFRATESSRNRLLAWNWLLAVGSFALVFAMFSYTEFESQKEWRGFPYRLFALPVPTWLLVSVPLVLGLGAVELLYLGWVRLVFAPGQILRPAWFAALVG